MRFRLSSTLPPRLLLALVSTPQVQRANDEINKGEQNCNRFPLTPQKCPLHQLSHWFQHRLTISSGLLLALKGWVNDWLLMAHIPPEQNSVVIIGAGPVNLTAAFELNQARCSGCSFRSGSDRWGLIPNRQLQGISV